MDEFSNRVSFGLSEEEKNDLEELIRASQQSSEAELGRSSPEELCSRIHELGDQTRVLANVVLELDERINLLYRIIRLCYQKTELLGERSRWSQAGHPDRRY